MKQELQYRFSVSPVDFIEKGGKPETNDDALGIVARSQGGYPNISRSRGTIFVQYLVSFISTSYPATSVN